MLSRLLIVLLFIGGISARADEFDALRLKWRDIIVGTGYETADPDVASRLSSIAGTASSNWTAMDQSPTRTFLWADLTSTTDSSHISSAYSRLRAMALAHATPGSSLFGNATMMADLASALDWMHVNRYGGTSVQYGNWWDWEIGSPLQLTDICVLIYDSLTATQRANYMAAVERQTPTPDMTQANKVWKARVVGVRGCVVKSSAKLALARDSFSSEFPYVSAGDGFYTDGSFVQHDYHAYTTGYGASLLSTMVPMLSWFSGSTWEVTDPALSNIYQWVYQSYEPVIYRGASFDMVRGREISRSGSSAQSTGHNVMDSILRIAEFAPAADAARMKRMIKYWAQTDTVRSFVANRPLPTLALAKQLMADPAVAPRGELVGHYTFAAMDRVVHLGKGYGFGLSMCSSRMANFESINGENLNGWFTGDGMTILYNSDLNQFGDGYWPTVDPYRLPGTTADVTHNKLPAVSLSSGPRAQGQNSRTAYNWVGGATLGEFGAAGMQLDGWGVTLTGKKSWFMFDDEIVCLGAGITSTDSRPIETTVENRKLNSSGNNAFTVNGITKSATPGWSEAMTGVNWAHLAGNSAEADIGYYFPQPATLGGVREARTGAWADVNSGSSSTPITRNYLRLGFEHGSNPSNASYQYVMLPGRSARRSGQYAELPQVAVIANNANVQAVSESTLGITAANFWTDATATAGIVTVDKKASVLVKNDGTFLEISVSDPTQANTGTITVQVAASANTLLSADTGITVTQMQPGISMTVNVSGSKGKTFRARFYSRSPRTVEITSLADTYVYDGALSTNYGSQSILAIKKSNAGSNREAFLRFNVPSWNGVLVSASLNVTPILAQTPGVHAVAKVTDTSWIESGTGGMTWSSKPVSAATALATWTPAVGISTNADVRAAITAGGLHSFRIYATTQTADGYVSYHSRESGTTASRPKLSLVIGNTPPEVALTSPSDGDFITHAGPITLAADAQATDGVLACVAFYSGSTLLGTDTSAPYTITAELGGGVHQLTAVATDSNGLSQTSFSRRIDIANPPAAATGAATILPNTTVDVDLRTLASDVETATPRLRFSLGAATHGSVTLLADGYTARFSPGANYSGPANFAYTVTDATTDDRAVLNYDFQAGTAADVSGLGRNGALIVQGTGSAIANPDFPAALAPQHSQSLRLTENGNAGAARVERVIATSDVDLIQANWTVAGWFKRTNTTNIDTLLQFGESGGWGSNALTLVIPNGTNTLELRNYSGSTQDVSIFKSSVTAGTWHHFAIVREGTLLRLYINGALAGSDTSFSLTFDPTKAVKFGGVSTATGSTAWERWWNGSVADFAIFSAALSAPEISKLGTLPVPNFGGQSTTNSVEISVLHPPAATNTEVATTRDTFVDIDLSTLASDVETPDSQLHFTLGNATNGSVVLLADGRTARFTPAAGHTGSANFSYTVTDATRDSRTFLNYRFQSENAADSSVHGRDGTVITQGTGGVSYPADAPAALVAQQSSSLFLAKNGTNGAARIDRSIPAAELDFVQADWTLTGWFKRNTTTGIDSVLQLGESGGWGNNALSLVLPAASSSIELRNYAGTTQNVGIVKSGITAGTWHHFAIVRSGSTLRLYINGLLAGSDSDFTLTIDPTKPLKFGGVSSVSTLWDRWLHGGLADLGVFDAALSAGDVTRLATAPTDYLNGQSASGIVSITVDLPSPNIIPPAATPYETWVATTYPSLSETDRTPTADPDRDGSTNFLEFALNGNPTDPSSNGLIASLIQNASAPATQELTLVIAVRSGAEFASGANGIRTASVSGITYIVEGSLDAVFPSAVVSSNPPAITAPAVTGLPDLTGSGWEYHTFKLDASEGLTGKGFLRLKVTQP